MTIRSQILENRIITIIRGDYQDSISSIVEALIAGGIYTLEITMNSPGVLAMITEVSQTFGEQITVGAGTVTTSEEVKQVADAGAQFIVSPDTFPVVIETALVHGLEPIPGALTPSEILTAKRAGAQLIKIFPAIAVGPDYLKQIRGPIDDLNFVPTGGISLQNAADYLKNGASALGIGSSLVPRNFTPTKDQIATLTSRATQFVATVNP